MVRRACYLAVLAAVTCVPALAQDGVYVKPKQGEYVQPKQSCGGSMTVDSDGQTITSPGYPSNYKNNVKCKWQITTQDPDAYLIVDCENFNLRLSRNCRGDRLVIFEDSQLQQRMCGAESQYYESIENNIVIKFRTNRWGTSKGFSCTVRSSTTESSSSTSDVMSSSTTTATPNTGTCPCGVANPSRIVGGVEVDPQNKYPWQVGLKMTGGRNFWCGGAIINSQYVLTAAHCFFDSQGNRESDEGLVVGVGDHNMYSTSDDVSGATRLVEVEKVTVHPNYNTRSFDNDIALIKLKETLDLSQYKEIGAVCLPADDSNTYAGMTATASGWGTTSYQGFQPAVLNEVDLPILDPSCWGKRGVTENMLCAGYREGGKDSCQGDSGGPLFVNEDSKYVQVGITSWGNGCASRNSPGVYARVSKFLDWIASNTADATSC